MGALGNLNWQQRINKNHSQACNDLGKSDDSSAVRGCSTCTLPSLRMGTSEEIGGGGQIRTVDSADMSRVL